MVTASREGTPAHGQTFLSRALREVLCVWRRDGWLIAGLIVAALVAFEAAVRRVFEMAHQVEVAHGLALLPALFILTALLLFHQYAKRQELKTHAAAATAAAAQANQRLLELERLATLSQSLSGCLNMEALQQAVWKHLPRLLGQHDAWVLTYADATWQVLVDTAGEGQDRLQFLQSQAMEALSHGAAAAPVLGGADGADTLHLPMVVGGRIVGVVGLPNASRVAASDRRLLEAITSLLAIAVRNIQLFLDTRDNALHDSLTGCLGRGHGLEVLARELDRVARKPAPVSVLMFDLDSFKSINDEHGHLVGDQVLSQVGQRIRQLLRGSDTKCRYGGDEFLVILPETPAEGAAHVADWLRQELSLLTIEAGGLQLSVRASFGVATTEQRLDVNELIRRADAALYDAKRAGRDRVRSFVPGQVLPDRRVSSSSTVM